MNKKYQVSLIVITLMLVCTIFVATSYAIWSITVVQNDTNIVATGCFDATLTNDNPIALGNAYPIQESKGLEQTPYTFTITNTCTIAASYEISLESLAETTLGNEYLRVSLDKQMSTLYSSMKDVTKYYDNSKTAKFLTKGKLGVGESISYDLRLWIDYDATLNNSANKTFAAKIIVINTATTLETLASQVELGDYINMSPTAETYTIPTTLTGHDVAQTINPRELNLWRVIRKNSDGTVDVVSEYSSSVYILFYGKTSYLNLVGGLNTIAGAYTNQKYVLNTRHMGYSNQIFTCTSLETCPADTGHEIDVNLVEATLGTLLTTKPNGDATYYYLASHHIDSTGTLYNALVVHPNGTIIPTFRNLYNSSENAESYGNNAIRPILTLKSSLDPVSGDGKSVATAYTFE